MDVNQLNNGVFFLGPLVQTTQGPSSKFKGIVDSVTREKNLPLTDSYSSFSALTTVLEFPGQSLLL